MTPGPDLNSSHRDSRRVGPSHAPAPHSPPDLPPGCGGSTGVRLSAPNPDLSSGTPATVCARTLVNTVGVIGKGSPCSSTALAVMFADYRGDAAGQVRLGSRICGAPQRLITMSEEGGRTRAKTAPCVAVLRVIGRARPSSRPPLTFSYGGNLQAPSALAETTAVPAIPRAWLLSAGSTSPRAPTCPRWSQRCGYDGSGSRASSIRRSSTNDRGMSCNSSLAA